MASSNAGSLPRWRVTPWQRSGWRPRWEHHRGHRLQPPGGAQSSPTDRHGRLVRFGAGGPASTLFARAAAAEKGILRGLCLGLEATLPRLYTGFASASPQRARRYRRVRRGRRPGLGLARVAAEPPPAPSKRLFNPRRRAHTRGAPRPTQPPSARSPPSRATKASSRACGEARARASAAP